MNRRVTKGLTVRSSEEQRLTRYRAGESDSSSNLLVANNLFQFTQPALGAASRSPATRVVGGAIRPAVEVFRGNQLIQQTF